jgi:hypothetical protein
MKRGAAIIAALEAYRVDKGDYPKELKELVPHYLKRIDPPPAGDRTWTYERRFADQFDLSVREPESARELYYWSKWPQWDYHNDSF